MTPDTTAYMIAGFVVILGGILIYVASILKRVNMARRQAIDLESMIENPPKEIGFNPED